MATFLGGTLVVVERNYKYKLGSYERNKVNFSRAKHEFNTLAVVWEDQVACSMTPGYGRTVRCTCPSIQRFAEVFLFIII